MSSALLMARLSALRKRENRGFAGLVARNNAVERERDVVGGAVDQGGVANEVLVPDHEPISDTVLAPHGTDTVA